MVANYDIVTQKLTKRYGNLIAIRDVDLRVRQGRLFALLGVNGAGKTTLIKMLTGLVRPDSGSATLLGIDVCKDTSSIKEFINVSPQETAVALNLTVRENLDFMAGVYSVVDASKKVATLMKQLKLESVANKVAKKLSGGYQRRLSIAMALINEPKILFLDEPTLGLDVLARRELWEIICDLRGKTTVVLTTHYMEEAEALADEIGVLMEGELIFTGTSAEMIKKARAKNFEDAFVALSTSAVQKEEL